MPYRFAAGPAVLVLLGGPALAQDDPQTVGVSVAGTVVEVPVEVAARACGVDAGTLLAEWEDLDTEMSTMADTTVAADATDLAPEVAADTALDATIDGVTPADGADATHEAAAAGTGQEATEGPAPPTEGTTLSKAAVCEVSQETAAEAGIPAPG
jgi:hypothetical protein